MKQRLKKAALFIFALIPVMLAFLSGCEFLGYEDAYFDEYSGLVFVVNKNPVNFDGYNTLEVIVDENEKFIFYGIRGEYFIEAKGEWIKNGKSTPVRISDYPDVFLKNDDYYIEVNTQYIDDLSLVGTEDDPYIEFETEYVGILRNNIDKPELYRVTKQETFLEDDYFGSVYIPAEFSSVATAVQYKTYMTEGLSDEFLLLPSESKFYSADSNTEFYSDEVGLSFNAETGKGTWNINGKVYPVKADFDKANCYITVCHDTDDELNGYIIFEGEIRQSSETALSYELYTKPDNSYDDSLKIFTLKKRTK